MQTSLFELYPDLEPPVALEPGLELEQGDLHIGRRLQVAELENFVGKNVVLSSWYKVEDQKFYSNIVVRITDFYKDVDPVYGCDDNPPDSRYGKLINTYIYNNRNAKASVPSYYHEVGRSSSIPYVTDKTEPFVADELHVLGGRWDAFITCGQEFHELVAAPEDKKSEV